MPVRVWSTLGVAISFALTAYAPVRAADAAAKTSPEEVLVYGRPMELVGSGVSANQGSVTAEEIAQRPLLRVGEIVETVPGVIVTQHSGPGKANQYFLRGFNLDHGTDLALSVDGVPINLPGHAHGQGYADLNFLMPELVRSVDYKKGPYYADIGDFGSAGAFNIHYVNALTHDFANAEAGDFGFIRAAAGLTRPLGVGALTAAGSYEVNDGPWQIPDDERKSSGVLRYVIGGDSNGISLTVSGYDNHFHSTDQVPVRAITQGMISRFGSIDTSDGGTTSRYALNLNAVRSQGNWTTRALAYAVYYDFDLFSNFTYFLNDPVHGDQIEQKDQRRIFGGKFSQTWTGTAWGREMRAAFGADLRQDRMETGLFATQLRKRWALTRLDQTVETNGAPFAELEVQWTDWMRSIIGLREDIFQFDVTNRFGGLSGAQAAGQFSPKAALVFGPFADTEFYVNIGRGFHSNDPRGAIDRINPVTPLARSTGAEFGIRSEAVPDLTSILTFWGLDIQSELVFAGDDGTTSPSGPTRRYGVEWANSYALSPFLSADLNLAWSHARYRNRQPDGQYVPEAIAGTADMGLALHDLGGTLKDWSGSLRLRYFGPRALTQDGAHKSKATSLVYAQINYAISHQWKMGVQAFNLLDRKVSDIDYFYASRLKGEASTGVEDTLTHPAEPRAFRVSLSAQF